MEEPKPTQDINIVQPDDMPPPELGQIDEFTSVEADDQTDDQPSENPADQGPITPTKPTDSQAQVTLKPKAKTNQKITVVIAIAIVMIILIVVSLLAYSKSPHS